MEALTSTQPAFKDRVAKALIDLVIVGVPALRSNGMYKPATERADGAKWSMRSHQEMVIAHYHARAHDA